MSASRFKRASTTLFTLIAMLTLWVSPAQATTLLHESFGDLVEKSEGIVVGTVLAKESQYGTGRSIHTFWTLGNLQVVSGVYAEAQLELRVLGGAVGSDRLSVLGAPSFAIGDRVVVFMRGNGMHAVPFVGWTQGVFRVRPDGVVEDHEGNRVFGIRNLQLETERRREPAVQIVGRPDTQATDARPFITLDGFVGAIREQAAARAKPALEIHSAARHPRIR